MIKPGGDEEVVARAMIQHRMAHAVLNEIKEHGEYGPGITRLANRLAERFDLNADQDLLRRKLYGEISITLTDVAMWVLCLGAQVFPVIQDRKELSGEQ